MTRKVDVVDVLHGTHVPDPYRWLEDGDSDDVRAWTEAQNARTRAWLDDGPAADRLRGRVRELLELGFCAPPAVRTTRGGERRYLHMRREGGQNQPILYVRDGVRSADRVLLDPSTLSADGTTALDWWYPSWDGALLAWGKSEGGSEESTLFVRDVASGTDLDLAIPHTQHASVAWLRDGSGFYYSRYPAPGSVPPGDEKYFCRIFLHRIGQDPSSDALVFDPGERTAIPSVLLSPNGRWLVVRVHKGWDESEVYVRDRMAGDGAEWRRVSDIEVGEHGEHARRLYEPIPRDGRLYMLTNALAPRYRLVALDWPDASAEGAVDTVIPEGPDVLEDVAILGDAIVAAYLHDASTRIERFDLRGGHVASIPLPSLGSASVTGAWDGDELFVGFTSFVTPPEVQRVDLATGAIEPWDKIRGALSLPAIEVRRLFATSKDGTRVPMFVVSRADAAARGGAAPAPLVLYGYGGFNVNQTPAFSARALATVENGGIWVSAVLRGGGEFGERWHEGGMLEKKQNVFDDFIACAEELVRRRITRPDRLAVMGGSNGGLLVAAVAVQRPDLFAAGLSLVPLTDMLRYHLFRIGKLWIPEYGSADDPAAFAYLHAYSPYHRVVDGTRYPAMLFATAESDSRVDPMHARKMAARMQEAVAVPSGDPARPILLRVESKAGHGQGKPVTKLVDEVVDELVFVFRCTGIPLN